MLGEVTFALIGALFLLTGLRTFLASLYQLLFGQVPNNTIGVIALAVFASAALAPLLARVYGQRRAVGLSALALGAATLFAAVSRLAWLDLVLSAISVIAGMWWLALVHASRPLDRSSPLPVALPLAIVADMALRHAFRTVPVVDLAPPLAVPLVLVATLVFVAAGLISMSDQRVWSAPGWRGAVALVAVGPLLIVGETGATNAAQVALAGGLGLGPEPARSTQLGALVIGVGLAGGALLLTRQLRRPLVGAAALLAGALLLWLRVPVLSLAGGAVMAAGFVVALSALVTSPPQPGRGALLTALPLALGWVLFVATGFAYHALYATEAVWAATALVALALVAVPAVPGPRMGAGAALVTGALAIAVPIAALFPFRAPLTAQPQASLRVMTYNVHSGFSNWQIPALDELVDTISRESPDVLALQEVARGWVITEQHDVLGVLAERLGMAYVWQPNIGDLYGNAILSRLPITDVRRVAYSKEPQLRHQQRGALAARVGGVTIIVTHLDEHADASEVRQRQMRELLRAWGGESPAIVTGDLNALPDSIELALLAQSGFSDLALEAGANESTFPSDRPVKRIDYVWGIGVSGAQAHTVASTASDHRALVVNVTRTAAYRSESLPR